MKTKTEQLDINESISLARNSIIDKIMAASVLFGTLASLIIFWRDDSIGINFVNSIFNFSGVIILAILWIYRKSISVQHKSAILFAIFFVIAIKSVNYLGAFSIGVILLCFCSMILVLSFPVRQSIYYSVLLSLTIPVLAYLFFAGQLEVPDNLNEILGSKVIWVSYYFDFLLASFIIIMGVGQLRAELNKYFSILKKTIIDLRQTNEQLTTEIEVKNAYEDSLVLSNQKFKSLFEGSRDGVLLLNSEAQLVEANPTVMEMTGYSFQELREMDIYQLVHPRYRDLMKQNFDEVIKGHHQPPLTEVIVYNKQNESLPVEFNTNLIITEDDVMVITTVRNISYRKTIENEKFNAVLEAEERERERFSKDLHDDLGPVFSTVKLYLQSLSSKEQDMEKKEVLENLSGIVDGAVKQVREISHNMSPYLLRDAGLVKAIKTHLKKFDDTEAIGTLFKNDLDPDISLAHTIEIVIYRVFLELLNNTMKHAEASEVRISLSNSKNELRFIYIDNGKGFDVDQMLDKNAGLGLKNIKNRVKAFKGTMSFHYEKGEMKTEINIPL